jgi:UDP-N-acetylmuramoyl-tripeptide--D-alanyl-D-alanine ligase
MQVEAAAAATSGTLVGPGAPRFEGVSTDSRQVRPGQAFVAVTGERFDGHAFLRQAAQAGAVLLVVSRELAPGEVPAGVGVLRVADTRRALGDLARAWRREVSPRVVAITGSVGKTTTKELTRAVLEREGATHATSGNLNNDIGLPLTLLAMPRDVRYLVVEMGMNAPGEIAYLTGVAEPEVGVITRVAPVHLEGLGSVEAVAAAKGELLLGLPANGWAVVPGDEPLLAPHLQRIPPERRVRFGTQAADEVRLLEVRGLGSEGSEVLLALGRETVSFRLLLPGAHNARNAAAAAAAGMVLGLSPPAIASALGMRPALSHRSVVREIGRWHVFDDCYNANPVAVCAALDTVADMARGGPMVAVLGSMLELGSEAERYHREVGAHAAQVGVDLLVTVGGLAGEIAFGARQAGLSPARVFQVEAVTEAARLVAERADPGAWILVKASRGARLEELIDRLQLSAGPRGPAKPDQGEETIGE